ncbi:WW domain-binding protein 11-like [Pollicipes pollicipes]|uniref:WW domain-binding protein 11-like n=1 Tax=Pollicipes pollicipes TaxID=41117 RepID=UPI0018858A4D|nr:WW domain-binding protein 11-like [Pollicipes pollicipes]
MGRRSINSTKSGKYMNPTDQARKEARRKELKKNKKQRMAVRHAVLKNKDPRELLQELEKIDKMEYSVDASAPLSEKVLKEKRKKLKETLERVLKLYEKEDPEYWADIRRSESEYEKKRGSLITYYESVKHAQQVQVEEIPLPQNLLPETVPAQIPLPPGLELPPPPAAGILKKHAEERELAPVRRGPPGVPPGPPPPLELPEDELEAAAAAGAAGAAGADSSDDDMEQDEPARARRIRFQGEEAPERAEERAKAASFNTMQLKMLQMSGQDIDSFMKESEQLMKQREDRGASDLQERLRAVGQPGPSAAAAAAGPPAPGPPPANPNVLSAAPQLRDKQSATIEAKPQIRNLGADVTRFVPSALRIKRDDKRRTDKKSGADAAEPGAAQPQRKPTKDDAYALFMSEMQGLL